MKYRILIYPELWSDDPISPCLPDHAESFLTQLFPNIPAHTGFPYTGNPEHFLVLGNLGIVYAAASIYMRHFKAAYCVIEWKDEKLTGLPNWNQEGLYYDPSQMIKGALRRRPGAYPLACLN